MLLPEFLSFSLAMALGLGLYVAVFMFWRRFLSPVRNRFFRVLLWPVKAAFLLTPLMIGQMTYATGTRVIIVEDDDQQKMAGAWRLYGTTSYDLGEGGSKDLVNTISPSDSIVVNETEAPLLVQEVVYLAENAASDATGRPVQFIMPQSVTEVKYSLDYYGWDSERPPEEIEAGPFGEQSERRYWLLWKQ